MRTRITAFTLIELLTVVAIISLLASLLIPAILHGRGKARSSRCIGNHRQLNLAWTLYAGDYDERLVPNPDSTLERGQGYGWVVGNARVPTVGTNEQVLLDSRVSALAAYVKEARIYKCPSDESEFVRSVAMNCRMNPTRYDGNPAWVGGLGTNFVNFRRLTDIGSPSEMLVILDERSDSINDSYFGIDMSNTGNANGLGTVRKYTIIDFPGDYHNDSLSASFADGHVELHQWNDFVKRRPLGNPTPRGVSEPGELDVKWLQDHSTYAK
ncbi:MAG: type II secretion system protein [Verrucomicrobia bacterium]|nr:type II secretion system protein [Verrucomicrobiota bacterium]